MKVLKHGKYVKEFICKDCSAVLEIVPHDLIIEDKDFEDSDYNMHHWHDEYIECPECGWRYYYKATDNGKDITEIMNRIQ